MIISLIDIKCKERRCQGASFVLERLGSIGTWAEEKGKALQAESNSFCKDGKPRRDIIANVNSPILSCKFGIIQNKF